MDAFSRTLMGMRPNEICQLAADDVKATSCGTVYIDVALDGSNEDDQGHTKSLKTVTSRRRVPIHPQLVAIGFLDFVTQRKKAGKHAKLFPELLPDEYGNHAKYALKRFREKYLPDAITVDQRQSFYSLRHNFRDALRRCNAPPDALQALGGWSQGKLVSDDYGDKADPDYQLQFMKQVTFPDLDLSFLELSPPA